MPTVRWTMPEARLEVTPLAAEQEGHGRLLARYRLVNESGERRKAELVLATRPFQVDPPYQFLNGGGGVAPLVTPECDGDVVRASSTEVVFSPRPSACGTLAFDEGPLRERLAAGDPPSEARIQDATGLATAAMSWAAELAPGAAIEVIACYHGCGVDSPRERPQPVEAEDFAAAEAAARESWRAALDGVDLDLPPEAAPLLRSMRSNLAWILIHRDGPGIQPGSRAYARSWIRDGALTGVALLRLRHAGEVREFARLVRRPPVSRRQGPLLRRPPRRRPGAGERQPRRAGAPDRRGLSLHAATATSLRSCSRTSPPPSTRSRRCDSSGAPTTTAPVRSSSSSACCRSRSATRATRPSPCTPTGMTPSPTAASTTR